MIIGIIILVMGLLLILQAMGFISGNFWMLFWGILLLVLGLKMVSKKRRCWHCEWMGYHNNNHQHEEEHEHK